MESVEERMEERVEKPVDGIVVVRDGHVAWVEIDRPAKRNALTAEMMDGLPRILAALGEDREVRCIVLTGRGAAFCAGGDLSTAMGVDDVTDEELVARFDRRHESARLLHELPVPTVAMVNGVAAGAGLALALACDLRIAGASAKLASAFAHVAFCGDFGGTWTLQRIVGPSRARQFYFGGETLGAEEAQAIGMVDRVVPDALLRDATSALAHGIAQGAPLAIRAMKANLNLALERDLATTLRAEARASVALMRTRDTQEALAAFVEKRKPSFVGR